MLCTVVFLFLKTMKITVAIVIAVTNANIPKMSKTLLIVSLLRLFGCCLGHFYSQD